MNKIAQIAGGAQRQVAPAILSALALFALSACVPNWPTADWSGYVSKDKVLRFFAGASCSTPWPFNPVSADAGFSQVDAFQEIRGRPWSYNIEYQTSDGKRHDRFDVVQWWTATGTRVTPDTEYGKDKPCAVLVDIPSKDGLRPYYLELEQAKTAEHDFLFTVQCLVPILLGWGFLLLLIPSEYGFEDSRAGLSAPGKQLIAFAAAIVVIGVNLAAGYICLSVPWGTFENARAYYAFFDGLPRSPTGGLLPINTNAFYFLIAGPPHPKDMQFYTGTYAWVTGLPAVAWLLGISPAFIKGVYYWMTPLPLEEAYQQALREGRTLSAEEIIAAMNKAMVGKATWQLKILSRKAEAFAQTFGYAARRNS